MSDVLARWELDAIKQDVSHLKQNQYQHASAHGLLMLEHKVARFEGRLDEIERRLYNLDQDFSRRLQVLEMNEWNI